METYISPPAMIDCSTFQRDRRIVLDTLDSDLIDAPIAALINRLNKLPYLFTLQCCHGHFLSCGGEDVQRLEMVSSISGIDKIEYRLAYIAFCIENSSSGRSFLKQLATIPLTDPDYIQFCSASWFWEQLANTYVLQVMPERIKDRDFSRLDYSEARKVEKVRDTFFLRINEIIPEY